MSDHRFPPRPQVQKSTENYRGRLPRKSELLDELPGFEENQAEVIDTAVAGTRTHFDLPYHIWWVQPEVATILEATNSEYGFRGPDYIVSELSSLAGRPARGRLWVSSSLNLPRDFSIAPIFKEKEDTQVALLAQRCGGIMIRTEDIHYCDRFGFVTDLQLRLVDPLTGTFTKPTLR